MSPLRYLWGWRIATDILLLLLWLLVPSCSIEEQKSSPTPYSARDDLQRMVTLDSPPHRIVSVAPSITETLFALGLDSSIVGVTDYCDYPPAALTKSRIGGMMNPNVEQIVGLQPDLVILSISGNSRADFDRLVSLGIDVYVSNPRTIDGIHKTIQDLGTLCGRSAEADSVSSSLRSQQERVIQRASHQTKKNVLLLLSLHPLIAVGEGTFIDQLLGLAHATNVIRGVSASYPIISREEVLELRPEVILVTTGLVRTVDDLSTTFPEWQSLPAVQQGNLVVVNADLISRPGPRIIMGLDTLASLIHR